MLRHIAKDILFFKMQENILERYNSLIANIHCTKYLSLEKY